MKIEITYKTWGKYALLNADETMCCLGHACLAYGVSKEQLRTVSLDGSTGPIGMPYSDWPVPAWMSQYIRSEASSVNDSTMELSTKVAEITRIFAEHGDEVVFVGDPADYAGDKQYRAK